MLVSWRHIHYPPSLCHIGKLSYVERPETINDHGKFITAHLCVLATTNSAMNSHDVEKINCSLIQLILEYIEKLNETLVLLLLPASFAYSTKVLCTDTSNVI